jgi:hypothetical protein
MNKMYFPLISALITEQLIYFLIKNDDFNLKTRKKLEVLIEKNINGMIDKGENTTSSGKKIFMTWDDVRSQNLFFNHLIKRSWSFPDSDTNGIVLSLIEYYNLAIRQKRISPNNSLQIKTRSSLLQSAYCETLLRYFSNAYNFTIPKGRKFINKNLKAYLVYFSEGMNDCDPAVNIDILQSLAANWENWKIADNKECINQISACFNYLHFLAVNELLFSNSLLQYYYTLPAIAFLWGRLVKTFETMSKNDKKIFDENGCITRIHKIAIGFWQAYILKQRNPQTENLFDFALIKYAFPELLIRS